jgi:hypothetical protein
MNGMLSDSALDEVMKAIPSAHHRAHFLQHNIAVDHQLRELKARVAELERDAQAPTDCTAMCEAERKKIVAWLIAENQGDTVRATYARKMAQKIEAGEYDR